MKYFEKYYFIMTKNNKVNAIIRLNNVWQVTTLIVISLNFDINKNLHNTGR